MIVKAIDIVEVAGSSPATPTIKKASFMDAFFVVRIVKQLEYKKTLLTIMSAMFLK